MARRKWIQGTLTGERQRTQTDTQEIPLKKNNFGLFFTVKIDRNWIKLSRQVVQSPLLELLRAQPDKAPSKVLLQALLWAGGLHRHLLLYNPTGL